MHISNNPETLYIRSLLFRNLILVSSKCGGFFYLGSFQLFFDLSTVRSVLHTVALSFVFYLKLKFGSFKHIFATFMKFVSFILFELATVWGISWGDVTPPGAHVASTRPKYF